MNLNRSKKFTGGMLLGMVMCWSPALGEEGVLPPLDTHIPRYTPHQRVAGKVDIIGSNTMDIFLKQWKEKLELLHPDLDIELKTEGSNTGVESLLSDKPSIAAMSRPLDEKEIRNFIKHMGYAPTAVPVAVDAFAVFVHQDNPLDRITFQQLDAIFSSERRRKAPESLDRWGQLGLSRHWEGAPIHVQVRDAKSGTAQFFREFVSKGGKDKESCEVQPGAASVVYAVMQDPYAIGYSGIGYRTDSVKPLRVAAREGEAFIEPTFNSATDGSYPLRRLLYLYVNQPPQAAPSPIFSEIMTFAVSLEGQQMVAKAGFFPPPTKDLLAVAAAWSQPRPSAARDTHNRAFSMVPRVD